MNKNNHFSFVGKKNAFLVLALFAIIICLFAFAEIKSRVVHAATPEESYTYEVDAEGNATLTAYLGTETEIVVPDVIAGMKVVGLKGTFLGKDTITKITIPATVREINDTAFAGCKAIQSFTVLPENEIFLNDADGVLMSKDQTVLYRYPVGRHVPQGTYTIPATVTTVFNYAFEGYSTQDIMIPANVKTIGDYAFANTGNFNGVSNWEEGTEVIGTYAFANCTNLKVKLPSTVKTIGVYAFTNCKNMMIDISKCAITEVADYLFFDCDNMSDFNSAQHNITLPPTVTRIGAYAFQNCNNLNEVIFPEAVNVIAEGAFSGCQNLHIVDIPEGVTAIENNTFDGCQNLNVVKLPESLTKIGDNAFSGCQNIHEINIPKNVTYISNTSFNGVDTSKIGMKYSIGKTKLKSVKKKGKKFKLTWTKVTGANGYEIYRSTKKSKGYKKIKTLNGNKKVTYIDGKGLKKKKTYYYKVRVVKKVGGFKYYSAFSNVKKIKKK